ncbi:hypothetical protein IMCC20628_04590 [Hoeflea sp. IMCC20628]|uniref:hypothetical protein n=1 Tax=Hoeflea sp. IMCC20628 TaxID=1620421 RepID=UPI00063BD4B8|nr:hypothetical protein [Hoeflea sp. IMCC20628]AKI03258.1 hypothetical protein IMCC20628_04590 [Hoeflea sp. IMCC20628]
MRESKDISEAAQRIQAIETKLAEKLRTTFGAKTPAPDVSAKADAIRGKSGELTKKLTEKEGDAWTGVQDELNRDLHALEGDFDHWVQYLDKHFKE